jgi:hypothetical protein
MKKGKISHVTGEHNVHGDGNETLTGFQKANVNYTKTDSGLGGFLFGVMLLILFGINAAFMLYVKHELDVIKLDLVKEQKTFENTIDSKLKDFQDEIIDVAISCGVYNKND